MNKTIYIFAIICISNVGYSQVPDSLLKNIELNNPTIKASLKWLEAEKARSRTGIYPNNPGFTYNYLWGSPDGIGDQQEFELTQSFQFPGYYFAKSSMQKMQFGQSEIMVEKTKNNILFKAQNEIITLIWLTKKETILSNRLKESFDLLALMQKGFERKEFSKPTFDKVRIYHLNNQTEMEKLKSEILVHKEMLQQLNGGIPVNFIFKNYGSVTFLPTLESLKEKLLEYNPDINIARINTVLSGEKVRVENFNRLPKV